MVVDYAIFCGCSFTWGQGLWSYSPTKWYVPTCIEYTQENAPIPPDADLFRIENRFAGVLQHMVPISNVIIKRHNGGTDEESLRFIDEVKNNEVGQETLLTQNVPWNGVKLCVFQTTQAYRSPFKFTYKNEEYQIRANPGFTGLTICDKIFTNNSGHKDFVELDNYEPFLNWLVDNNLTPDDFYKIHTTQIMNKIENKFKELEGDGIKCVLLSWTDDYLHLIKENNYLNERFVPIKYKGVSYDTIEMIIEKFNMDIMGDKTKLHDCGGDNHPSLELHKVIAKSLYPKIKQRLDE